MTDQPKVSQRGVPAVVQRVLHSGRVWTIQGVGTLLLLAVGYGWLWMREAHWWQLAVSALLALLIAYLAAFLQRTALRIYRRDRLGAVGAPPPVPGGARPRRAVREWLPGAAIVFVLFLAVAWASGAIDDRMPDAMQVAASWLTLHLRRPVDPTRLQQRWETIDFLLPWFFFVILWLPPAAAALLGEAAIWGAALRAWRKLRYWLGTLACAAVGYVTFVKLAGWVPEVRGLGAQTMSMVARVGLGYVILLGSWLVTLALVEESIAGHRAVSPDETWD